MRTRSGEQDGVNVRQPKVICTLFRDVLVCWREEARQHKPEPTLGPIWCLGFKYRFFSLQCVCILNKPYFGLTVEIAYFLWPGSSGLTPSPLFSDPNYIIHLICSNSLLLFPLSLSHQQLEPISRAFILSNSGGLLGLLCGFCFLFDIRPW